MYPYTQSRTFDPASNRASGDIPMYVPRLLHTATRLAGAPEAVLITGGTNAANQAENSAELFEVKTSTFRPTSAMTTARSGHRATMLNDGRVLITGGTDNKTPEVYK